MASEKFLILVILLINFVSSQTFNNCDNKFNTSEYSIQYGNGGFYLSIRDGNGDLVERFKPGQHYEISVTNNMIDVKFETFQINAFPSQQVNRIESLGKFKYPKYIAEDENCSGVFKNKEKTSVSKVNLKWTAPQYPEQCMNFHATVVMDTNLVYQNSHNLKKTICSKEMFAFKNNEPVVNNGVKTAFKHCCACGTASYRVTFHGLWNKTTHPRDWPQEKGQLHWTDPVGVTHNHNYFIYNLGGQASYPVSSVCTTGNSKSLKEELISPENRLNVKSLFSSGWINGEDQLNEERSGFISVNRTHSLFSLISMMGPSPDWCVGVPGIDLCMEGCKWKSNLTIPLYPFDTGIQTGETYKPDNVYRLDEPEPIREINRNWMKNNPFTPNTPVAEIILTRIEPKIDSQCVAKPIHGVNEFNNMNKISKVSSQKKNHGIAKYNVLDDPQLAQMAKAFCGFTEWTNWTPCSVNCGVGETFRKRDLIKNLKNELCIQLPRDETRNCYGRRRTCDFSKKCSLLPWTEWTKCTATCTTEGKMFRTRNFVRESEKEECLNKAKSTISLKEIKSCKLDKTDSRCDSISICSAGKPFPCTRGTRRTRYFYHVKSEKCEPFDYYDYCKKGLNSFISEIECENTCTKVIKELPKIKRFNLALLQARTSFSSDQNLFNHQKKIPSQCFKEIEATKTCKTSSPRTIWYYSNRNRKCRPLVDFSCTETVNKFSTYEDCMEICRPNSQQDLTINAKVNCQVSNWTSWRECSEKCGWGIQFRKRVIQKDSLNGGEPCPLLFDSRSCYGNFC